MKTEALDAEVHGLVIDELRGARVGEGPLSIVERVVGRLKSPNAPLHEGRSRIETTEEDNSMSSKKNGKPKPVERELVDQAKREIINKLGEGDYGIDDLTDACSSNSNDASDAVAEALKELSTEGRIEMVDDDLYRALPIADQPDEEPSEEGAWTPEALRNEIGGIVLCDGDPPTSLDDVYLHFADDIAKDATSKDAVLAAVESLEPHFVFDREARMISVAPKASAITPAQQGISMSSPGPRHVGTRYLECGLGPVELAAFHERRTKIDAQIDRLILEQAGHKQCASNAKKEIDELTKEARRISADIRNSETMRNVPCEERREIDNRPGPSFGKEIAITYRLDTQTEVGRRELRGDERQGFLFDPPAEPEALATEVGRRELRGDERQGFLFDPPAEPEALATEVKTEEKPKRKKKADAGANDTTGASA